VLTVQEEEEVDGAIDEDREAGRPAHLVLKKLARALEEFGTYVDNNASGIGYSVVNNNDPAPLLQGI
jgi:hypothetical protein